MTENKRALFWHRRDLRIQDNAALFQALKESNQVYPVFIFDTNILSELPQNDQRILFLHREIHRLKQEYQKLGSDLEVLSGDPLKLIPELCLKHKVSHLYANRDYEPYALMRDREIYTQLEAQQKSFRSYKDHVVFDRNEVLKADGSPYTIFTPYSRKWKEKLNDFYMKPYPVESYLNNLAEISVPRELPSIISLGFEESQIQNFPTKQIDQKKIRDYTSKRDFPALDASSQLSIHLRFGTISIREVAKIASVTNETFLNEIIWRDFYQMILYHFPHSASQSFKKAYDHIRWENNEEQFKNWCAGKTGYPLVDAGMRELNETGFMHNRVRMVTASFLCKHLLIDWRWGEAYFAEKLLDFDLASNVGGWQWASGSGCDAAPYFRVFSPSAQQQKFDPDFEYIRKWVAEYGTDSYPEPIVEHAFARNRAIERYKEALKNR